MNESVAGLDVIGVGSPIMDTLARVDEGFVTALGGAKGGMEMVDAAAMRSILGRLPGPVTHAPGGSAANTVFGLARLGLRCRFLGKVGRDEAGDRYLHAFRQRGGDCSAFKTHPHEPTGRCLSLVTPDSQRTMRTHLGAAMTLSPDEVTSDDFRGARLAHLEGYLLFNRDLILAALRAARQAGCQISLDLGTLEVVRDARDFVRDLLRDYVDIVLANEDETAAFCAQSDPERGLEALAALCPIAAVKLGSKGALVSWNGRRAAIPALTVPAPVDTTGAGDLWATGFLYGLLRGRPVEQCGAWGARLGAEVVQHLGAWIPEERWAAISEQFRNESRVQEVTA